MDSSAVSTKFFDKPAGKATRTYAVNFLIVFASGVSYMLMDKSKRPIVAGAALGSVVGHLISKNKANPIVGTLIGTAVGLAAGYAIKDNETVQSIMPDFPFQNK